ncbi:MAG: priB, partial [Nitrososphaeraceae archaeon]|nr:priB [Nitrososphaeraceae archaeon]
KYEIEILTFLVTLMIAKSIGIESILKKYSLFEAMRTEKYLTEDLRKERNNERKRLLLFKIFEDLFNINVDLDSKDTNLFKVRVTDYLTRALNFHEEEWNFHEEEWKLINRLVHNGYVYLDADETVRLIRSELTSLIYSRIKTMTLSNLPHSIKAKVDDLRIKLQPQIIHHA